MLGEPQATFPFTSTQISHSVKLTCPQMFSVRVKAYSVWQLYRFLPFQRS